MMKKMLEKLKKPKKKESQVYASNQLCKDAVPDAPRDLEIEVPSKKDIYKNFRIDNSCKSSEQHKPNCCRSNSDDLTSVRENSLNYFHPSSLTSEAVPTDDPSTRQRSISAPQETTQNLVGESHVSTNGLDAEQSGSDVPEHGSRSGSESSESENGAPSRRENDNSCSVKSDSSIEQRKSKQKKNNANTVVITINDSSHFHIGSQKNVFVNSPESGGLQIENLKSNHKQPQQNLHFRNDLLHVTRPITTQELTKIASHINDNWKELGKHLGISQSEIDEIVMVNDNNSNVIAFDMFKRILEKNPEMSVGFIAEVLAKSNQYRAIQQLTA